MPGKPAPVARKPAPAGRGQGLLISLRRGGTSWMVLGALIAAAGAYLFQMLTARVIGSHDYAPLSVLWTLQYLLLSIVLYSVEAWALRAVRLAGGDAGRLRSGAGSLVGQLAGLAVLLGLISWWYRGPLFHGAGSLAVVVGLTVATYTVFVLCRALLAGRQRYAAYGIVTALESVIRLVLAAVVLAAGGRTAGIAWIMPLGALGAAGYWFIARRKRPYTGPLSSQDDAAGDGSARFLLATVPANACGQLLLAGGPLVLVAVNARSEAVSTFFVAITAARVPLVIAQGGLLSRLLPTFTELARTGRGSRLARLTIRIGIGGSACALVAGGLAALAGPPILGLLYGAGFRPSRLLAAGAIVGVLLAATSMLLNQIVIACRREKWLAPPWLLGLSAAAVSVAAAPGSPENRVLLAFVLGQLVALIGLLLTALRLTARLTAQPVARPTGPA